MANLSEVSKKKTVTEPAGETDSEPVLEPETTEQQDDAVKPEAPAREPGPKNDTSNLVRTPGISIKDSLKSTSVSTPSVEDPISEQLVETRPEEDTADSTNPDDILQAWNHYAESIEKSKPRIYSTLVHNSPVIRTDGSVMVMLNSEAQRDNFIKNIRAELIAFIQNATGLSDIEVITEVSASAQNGTKIYTEQDKLDFLVRKNPELRKLKTRFNLDFDE
jgi:hypothetical protein